MTIAECGVKQSAEESNCLRYAPCAMRSEAIADFELTTLGTFNFSSL